MSNQYSRFNRHLSVILDDVASGRNLRPAIIITRRNKEIRADHARWVKGRNGKIFLAVGVGLGDVSVRKGKNWNYGPLSKARDFYSPPQYEATNELDEKGNYETRCINCRMWRRWHELGHPLACDNYTPGGTYDAHKTLIKTRKFDKILTIQKENVVSLKWLDNG